MGDFKLETVTRGYLQQMSAAMQGDIRNALIELITNADDAYVSSQGSGKTGQTIKVTIEDFNPEDFEYHFEEKVVAVVSVSDAAGGIEPGKMKDKFTQYGAATSHLADGGLSRGIFGRGAKDVSVFGYASFHTVRGGLFAELTFSPNGGKDFEARPAGKQERAFLALNEDESGLRASVLITEKNLKSAPAFGKLADTLKNEAQLKWVLETRHVTLEDKRNGNYVQLLPTHEVGKLLINKHYTLKDFSEPIHLKVFQLSTENDEEVTSLSNHGMLAHCGRVAFENSWFSFKQHSGAEWLRAELDLPNALEQVRQDNIDGLATGTLIDPSRKGLNRSHPYVVQALEAIGGELLQVMKKISAEKQAGQGESERLRKVDHIAAAAVGKLLKEFFESLDDEQSGAGQTASLSDFDAIPPMLRVAPNSKGTVTLRTKEDLVQAQFSVIAGFDPSEPGPPSGPFGADIKQEWKRHPRLDRHITQWRFESGQNEGLFTVRFVLGKEVAETQILVSSAEMNEEYIPTRMQFEKGSVQVSPNRGKNLVLVGPVELAGTDFTLSAEGVEVQCPQSGVLGLSHSGKRAVCVVHIVAGNRQGLVKVNAHNSSTGEDSFVEVNVKLDPGFKGLLPDFKIDPMENPKNRGVFKILDGVWTSVVYARHTSFNRMFGEVAAGQFENEEADEVRLTIALTHAEQIAGFMAEQEGLANPEWDAARVMRAFFRRHQHLAGILSSIYREKQA